MLNSSKIASYLMGLSVLCWAHLGVGQSFVQMPMGNGNHRAGQFQWNDGGHTNSPYGGSGGGGYYAPNAQAKPGDTLGVTDSYGGPTQHCNSHEYGQEGFFIYADENSVSLRANTVHFRMKARIVKCGYNEALGYHWRDYYSYLDHPLQSTFRVRAQETNHLVALTAHPTRSRFYYRGKQMPGNIYDLTGQMQLEDAIGSDWESFAGHSILRCFRVYWGYPEHDVGYWQLVWKLKIEGSTGGYTSFSGQRLSHGSGGSNNGRRGGAQVLPQGSRVVMTAEDVYTGNGIVVGDNNRTLTQIAEEGGTVNLNNGDRIDVAGDSVTYNITVEPGATLNIYGHQPPTGSITDQAPAPQEQTELPPK